MCFLEKVKLFVPTHETETPAACTWDPNTDVSECLDLSCASQPDSRYLLPSWEIQSGDQKVAEKSVERGFFFTVRMHVKQRKNNKKTNNSAGCFKELVGIWDIFLMAPLRNEAPRTTVGSKSLSGSSTSWCRNKQEINFLCDIHLVKILDRGHSDRSVSSKYDFLLLFYWKQLRGCTAGVCGYDLDDRGVTLDHQVPPGTPQGLRTRSFHLITCKCVADTRKVRGVGGLWNGLCSGAEPAHRIVSKSSF